MYIYIYIYIEREREREGERERCLFSLRALLRCAVRKAIPVPMSPGMSLAISGGQRCSMQ